MSNQNNALKKALMLTGMGGRFRKKPRTEIPTSDFIKHCMYAFMIMFLGLAGLTFINSPAQAEATCGGVDKNGKLQATCESVPAKYKGKPSTSCPKGQIYDLEACWSCPSGYSRSGDHISTKTACHKVTDKDIFTDTKPAKRLKGVSKCPSGSFFDLYNGGTCWRCPSGYNRTIFDPIYSDKACERVTPILNFSWRKAEFKGSECGGDNAFYDLIDGGTCWSCPDGYVRTIFSVKDSKACGRPVFETASAVKESQSGCKQYGSNAFWDPKNFGSCYSCPAGYTRSKESVDSPRGCLAPAIEWEMKPYAGKGFMQMDGAAEVVLKLINERKELERVAVNIGNAVGADRTRSIESLWQEIAQFPEESLSLRYAVLNHVIDAVQSGRAPPSSPEGRLVREIETFANGYRVYLATQAVKAYDVWYAAQTLKLKNKNEANAKAGRSDMRFLFSDQLPVPPDFQQVTNRAALVNTVAAIPTLGMFSTALIPLDEDTVADQIIRRSFPNRTDPPDPADVMIDWDDKIKRVGQEAGDSVDNILGSSDDLGKVASKVGQEIGEKADDAARVAAKSAFKISKKLITKMLAVSGPQIVIEIAMAVFEAELNKNLAKADARPALMRALEHAKSYKPSLKVWLQNKDEAAKVYSYWALATSNEVQPAASVLKKIEAAASAHYKQVRFTSDPLYFVRKEGQWHNFEGSATAISAGPAGDIWHVGGGKIYWADATSDNKWTTIGGGNTFVDIAAMPTRKSAFALLKDGSMKAYIGNSWRNISGSASAIDVSASGRKWHIGGNNSLYVSGEDDFRWRRVNGPKAKKISAGPGKMLWVIDTHDKLHYYLNDQWKDLGRKAKDVAVSPYGAVWMTSLEDKVFRLSYNGSWKEAGGGTVRQVDAGPAGTVWALRPDDAIIVYRHKSTPRPPMADPGLLKDTSKSVVQDNGLVITPIEIDLDPTVTVYGMAGPKKWRDESGWASQVSIGESGDVWHVGGSGSLYIRPEKGMGWKQVLASGVAQVEAGRLKNNAFILTTDGKMWNIDSLGKKTSISGSASDIAVDTAGTKWHIGGGGTVYRMAGSGWVKIPGVLSKVAAGGNGEVWAVGKKGEIYRFANNRWNEIPGSARDVAVGRDGSVWHLGGPDGTVLYEWDKKKKKWKGVDETRAQTVSVGSNGEIWVARPDGSMTAYK